MITKKYGIRPLRSSTQRSHVKKVVARKELAGNVLDASSVSTSFQNMPFENFDR